MPTKRDYYEVIGLKKGATAAEIKSAYRKMALQFHPDRNKAPDAETKFKEINEAYQILSDEKKRQAYDQFGHAAFDPAAGGAAGNPFAGGFQNGPFTWSYSSSGAQGNPFQGADFGDPFDIFESFFGGGFAANNRRPRYSLQIEFMDAVKGATKTVEIDKKSHTIKIPPGADDGTRIRFENFDITLSVRNHPLFKRDGADLYVDQFISYTMAVLGGMVVVPGIENDLKMKVRAGTQSHSLVRLQGEGVARLQGRGKGDLYVRLIVKVPERVGREEKRILEELQQIES